MPFSAQNASRLERYTETLLHAYDGASILTRANDLTRNSLQSYNIGPYTVFQTWRIKRFYINYTSQ